MIGEVHWEVKHAELTEKEVYRNKQASKDKQVIYWSLPAGMNKEQAMEWVTALDFSGKGSPSELTKESVFQPAGEFVKHLRHLSHRGKKETDRLARTEAGRRKIVWGFPLTKAEQKELKAEQARLAREKSSSKVERKMKRNAKKRAKIAESLQQKGEENASVEVPEPPAFSEPFKYNRQALAASEEVLASAREKGSRIAMILESKYPTNIPSTEDSMSETPRPSLPPITPSWAIPSVHTSKS